MCLPRWLGCARERPGCSGRNRQRGFALLVGRRRILRHVTASPSRIGQFAQAALVPTHFEHGIYPVEITSIDQGSFPWDIRSAVQQWR
jgi:hypothetical protein